MPSHAGERGFTLIEMIVALALLALISLAGLALVDSVLAARLRTQGRLDRLADLERAAYLIDADLTRIGAGRLDAGPRGIGFVRGGRAPHRIAYVAQGGTLFRIVDGRVERLLTGVADARWSLLAPGGGWRTTWPPSRDRADSWPAAVAAEIVLAVEPGRPTGTLRRVVALPAHP